MRKLLNTLYITNPDVYLSREGEQVVVKNEGKKSIAVPIHNLEGIISFGYCGASPALMGLCAEKGVSVTFLTEYGKYLASVQGPFSGNILLRKEQFRIAEDSERRLGVSVNFIVAKIMNSRTVLKRAIRDYEEIAGKQQISFVVERLGRQAENARHALNEDELRGIEGDAAKMYFGVFDNLILHEKESFFFHGRSRRPPLDNMNALLSFTYVLLAHEVKSAIEAVGLDPAAGFFHKDRPGRNGLALDMMEELRAYLADRFVLSLVNRRQVSAKDFVVKENRAILMDDDMRKKLLTEWQKRKRIDIKHPYTKEKISLGLLPYIQAQLMARFIRGDIDGYPPFLWR
ncbi:MAG: type I-C CRISPR-associated endonuclease Cas1 [Peptostreptococcaceae bacterium]|nr:type I-C CRISPR-associated endonuclease Cas1 [Peptostreptococcaceae bacterium]